MLHTQTTRLCKTTLASAMAVAIGAGISSTANADTYVWTSSTSGDVTFTMLDSGGGALENSSKPNGKAANNYQTPTTGTFTYHTHSQDGSATIAGFDFYSGSLPAVAAGIAINKIPSGLDDGSGNLILANMLFDWDGKNGIPVSLVWDAQGILSEMDGTGSSFVLVDDGIGSNNADSAKVSITTSNAFTGVGAIPASDGTYTGVSFGYLNLGVKPLATLSFNTTNLGTCVYGVDANYADNIGGGCMGINPSADAAAPIVTDNSINNNDYDMTTPTYSDLANDGIGGYPMQDGPFSGFNANFEFDNMVLTSFIDTTKPSISLSTTVINVPQSSSYTPATATCTDAAPLNTNLNSSVVIGGDTVLNTTVGTYFVTYDCKDGTGNQATTATVTVNVTPAGTPSLTILGDAPPNNHECGTVYTDPGATATDAVDDDVILTADIVATPNNGVDFTKGVIDPGTKGEQTIDYDVTDSDSLVAPTVTRTVTVIDTTAPDVTVTTNPHDVLSSTPQNPQTYTDPADAEANDVCDGGPISILTASSGSVTMVVPDTGPAIVANSLSYSWTDNAGITNSVTRIVNVTRAQPVITLVGSGNQVFALNETYVESGMDIADAQDGDVTDIITSGSGSSQCLGGGGGGGGGSSTCTIDASAVDTSTRGTYEVTYNVTDTHGNIATQVTRSVKVGAYAVGSNFTMLDKAGNTFGGTNDVVFEWDEISLYTSESDTGSNISITSAGPEPFNSAVWIAHDARIFGPGTYSFDSGCTTVEVQTTGCPAGSATNTGPAISMTVPAGHYGGHILFDWNNNPNIDVVNVWDASGTGVWYDPDGDLSAANNLFVGRAGLAPDLDTTWKLVSIDLDNDGFNGTKMVDGPFDGFYANFNAGPASVGVEAPPIKMTAPDSKLEDAAVGSLGLGGLLCLPSLVSFIRKRKKR